VGTCISVRLVITLEPFQLITEQALWKGLPGAAPGAGSVNTWCPQTSVAGT
jgi:hypothetical protein